MPSKSLDKLVDRKVQGHNSVYNWVDGELISSSNTPVVLQSYFYRRTGVSYSSPRDSKGKLILKSQPYERNVFQCSYAPGSFDSVTEQGSPTDFEPGGCYTRTAFNRQVKREVILTPLATGAETFSLPGPGDASYDKASTNYYKEAFDMKANLALALKERQKTISLIASTATKLSSSLLYLRKGQFKKAANSLGVISRSKSKKKRLADQWLELQYGWNPLLQEVYGALQIPDSPPRFPIKATGREKFTEQIVDGNWVLDVEGSKLVTAKALVNVNDIPSHRLANQLGLANPALVAWELIPFSFLVDWFLPVGSWLEAHSPLVGLSFADQSTTLSVKGKISSSSYSLPSNVFDETTLTTFCGYSYISNRVDKQYSAPTISDCEFSRKLRNVGHISMPQRPQLHFKNPLSVGHAQNALALLVSIFSRR